MKLKQSLLPGGFLCVGMLLAASPAQAWGGRAGGAHVARANGATQRSGTYDSQHLGSGTFNSTVNRQPGSATGSTGWTNANGGSGQHNFNNTSSNTGNGTGTGTHESSTTYANGKTSSSQGAVTKTAPGDYTYSGTHTGVNGNITDVSKTSTASNGSRTVATTYDNTATGKTTTSDQTFTRDGNGYTQTGTVTGPNGGTSTDNRGVNYTKDANGEITRTMNGSVTGPNGHTQQVGNSETYNKTYTPNPASASGQD